MKSEYSTTNAAELPEYTAVPDGEPNPSLTKSKDKRIEEEEDPSNANLAHIKEEGEPLGANFA